VLHVIPVSQPTAVMTRHENYQHLRLPVTADEVKNNLTRLVHRIAGTI